MATPRMSMRELRARGIAPRPGWRLRGFLDPRRGVEGPIVCLELPRGMASTAADALAVANREYPKVMRLVPADQWRAYPVVTVTAAVRDRQQAG